MHRISELRDLELSHAEIAGTVTKVGGGHPSREAIAQLRREITANPDWHPGTRSAERKKPGPQPACSAQRKRNIAECAMAMRRRGELVTVEAVQARCAQAAKNPDTGLPFHKKMILGIFRKLCHDGNPAETWDRYLPYCKTALPPELAPLRMRWAERVLAECDQAGWYYRHCIWFDPCNTVVPKGLRAVFNQRQAARGKYKFWMSKGSRKDNRNLSASKHGGKQAGSGDKRVWWFVVLSRGVVRLKVMPDWTQNGIGFADFVNGLNPLLDDMFGANAAKPRVCFTDRGPGMYNSLSGEIVRPYYEALRANGFRPFAGVDGSWQPPDLADFFLHETVVSWVRKYFRKHPFGVVEDINVNYRLFLKQMRDCEQHINATYNVDGLCRDTVKRLLDLKEKNGYRLKH